MDNLRKIRKKNGESMKSLGVIVGVSESAISQYETGKRQPSFETLLKLAEYYNVSVDYLLGNADNPLFPYSEYEANSSVVVEEGSHGYDHDELTPFLDELRHRPEMKMLFSVAKKASKEDVEKAVKIIEMFKGNDSDGDDI